MSQPPTSRYQPEYHLREIERRRLFSKLKYKSSFDYAVKHLKYSADQAGRRIAAMRLLRALPQIEEKIESGALSLTSLSMAQSLFRKEEFSAPKKLQLIQEIENKSTRDVEKIVISHSSQPTPRPPKVRSAPESRATVKPHKIVGREVDQGNILWAPKGLRVKKQSALKAPPSREKLARRGSSTSAPRQIFISAKTQRISISAAARRQTPG